MVTDSLYLGGSNSGFRAVTNADDGFIITGYASAYTNFSNVWVVKIDAIGNSIWSNEYGEEFNDGGNAVAWLSDGNIGVTGFSHLNPGNQDIIVLKIDNSGNEQWRKTFGGDERDIGHDIIPSENGVNFILIEH